MTTTTTTEQPVLVISYKIRTSQMPAGIFLGSSLSPQVLKKGSLILYRGLTYIVIDVKHKQNARSENIATVKLA